MTLADLRTVHECCSSGEDLHVGTTRAKKKKKENVKMYMQVQQGQQCRCNKRECEDIQVGTTRATKECEDVHVGTTKENVTSTCRHKGNF